MVVTMDSRACYYLSFILGIVMHIVYFNRYDCHRKLHGILWCFLSAVVACQWLSVKVLDSWSRGTITTARVVPCCIGGAVCSTIVYRLFFNPLNRFPGPYCARMTDLWLTFRVWRHSDQYKQLDELHKTYGAYVRTGANQLSIIDPNLVNLAYSACQKSGVRKANWYDYDWPTPSLLSERVLEAHSKRRKLWAPAFSDKALRGHEIKIKEINKKLLVTVDEAQSANGHVDVSKMFGLYSFDVMGSLVFGEDYQMLENSKNHCALRLLTEGMACMGLALPIWFFSCISAIPWDIAGARHFNAFCNVQTERAVSKHRCQTSQSGHLPASHKSILSTVLDSYGARPGLENDRSLQTDARLLIIAGSDTTAAALTYLFFHLAQSPAVAQRIREEIYMNTQGATDYTHKDLQHCEHLNGAINESLRLHHPGPSGVHRVIPANGLHVGENAFIPGGTNFNIPFHSLYRDESIYTNADVFIPERWYARTDMIKREDAFTPFLAGPYSCLGKALALIELRTLSATLLTRYDISLAPGEDGSRLLNCSKDHFTMSLAPLHILFVCR